MSVAVKYSDTIHWGTTGAGTTAHGKIISASRKLTQKTAEIMGETGELSSLVLYDQREEWDVEVLALKTVTLPALGATASFGATGGGGAVADLIVMSVDLKWTAGAEAKIAMTLMKSVA